MDEVLGFIQHRFTKDCDWVSGNCYYFALILKDRFPGGIVYYDVIDGHFVYLYKGKYYDWTGIVEPEGCLVEWDKFAEYDHIQKNRIVEDCLM